MSDFGSAFGPVQAVKPTADERKHIEVVEKLAGIQAVLVDTTTVLLTLLEREAHPPMVVQPDGTDLSPLIDALNRPYPVPPSAEALAEALARRLPDHGLALAAVSETMAATAKQLERLNKKVNASAISPSGGSSGHVIVDSGQMTLTGSEFPWSSVDRVRVEALGKEVTLDLVRAAVDAINADLDVALSTRATEATLAALRDRTPTLVGTWGYSAGVAGTVNVAAGRRVIGIAASAGSAAGSLTINGGDTVTIPANQSVSIAPLANLTAPTLVFTSTASYFVETLA